MRMRVGEHLAHAIRELEGPISRCIAAIDDHVSAKNVRLTLSFQGSR